VTRRFQLELAGLRQAGLLRPLLPIAAFELGNLATTLLILRATTVLHTSGRSLAAATTLAIVIYAGHNPFAAVIAYAGGDWIDRSGPRVASSQASTFTLSTRWRLCLTARSSATCPPTSRSPTKRFAQSRRWTSTTSMMPEEPALPSVIAFVRGEEARWQI